MPEDHRLLSLFWQSAYACCAGNQGVIIRVAERLARNPAASADYRVEVPWVLEWAARGLQIKTCDIQ